MMRIQPRLLFLILFLTAPLIMLSAQAGISASFTASTSAPRIGEPFTVRLVIESPEAITLLDSAALQASQILEIIETSEPVYNDTSTRIEVTYTVRLWRSGEYLSPEQFASIQSSNQARQIPIQSFFVTVPSEVNDPTNATLRPALPPILLPVPWRSWYPWVMLSCVLISLPAFVAVFRIIRRTEGGSGREPGAASIAGALLVDLQTQNLTTAEQFPIISLIIRNFIQQQWKIPAVEMTTSELIESLRENNVVDTALRKQLQQFLEQADLVKFAQYRPEPDHNQRLIAFASRWIQASLSGKQEPSS
jgi:hypothetical protein